MKKILVPTDFSEHSESALRAAAQIAKKQNAEIIVLHLHNVSDSVLTKTTNSNKPEAVFYIKLAQQRFTEFLNVDFLKGIKVTETIHNFTNFTEINNIAKQADVDLIVMGSHGSSGMKEYFVGSNTEKVVRTSEIPVLVIKQDVSDFDLQSAVFACDFTSEFIEVYKKAKKLFETFNIKMKLVYINMPSSFRSTSEIEKTILNFLLEAGEPNPFETLNSVALYNDYTIEEGIFAYSRLTNADLIALPTHGRRGLSHFFSGSIGEAVVNHSDMPVITFKI